MKSMHGLYSIEGFVLARGCLAEKIVLVAKGKALFR
jgi:hypothetical protein